MTSVLASDDEHPLGRWALVGSGPAGRFLLERWSLRQDFPLVAFAANPAETQPASVPTTLPLQTDVQALLDDPQLIGLIVTTPTANRLPLLQAARAAGKRLLIESSLGDLSADIKLLERWVAAPGPSIGVFHIRRSDLDFHAGRAALLSGRLGAVQSVRWINSEFSAPAGPQSSVNRPGWQSVISRIGPWLFDELSQLMTVSPLTVQAWPLPHTAGFQARINYPSAATAWIDVQRAALSGLKTGWVLEGETGAYHAGRLMTVAADGELREEVLPGVNGIPDEVMADLRRLATSAEASATSLRRSLQSLKLCQAIQQAADTESLVHLS